MFTLVQLKKFNNNIAVINQNNVKYSNIKKSYLFKLNRFDTNDVKIRK